MTKTRKADSRHEERRAVAYAIGWMERRTGHGIGTSRRPAGHGFPGQRRSDPAGLRRRSHQYHELPPDPGAQWVPEAPQRRHAVFQGNLLRGVAGWPHWTAVLKETANGQRWAVDSWIYANGENPAIVEAEKWYISSLAELPAATR